MDAQDIAKVAVIGAGTMGAGIAGVFARAGCHVRLMDLDESLIEHGMALLETAQTALVQERWLSARNARAALNRVAPATNLETACDGVQLLIEAVSERLEVKRELFRQFDALCPKSAVLASNTSGLSITEIACATRRPKRLAGMHFWNPPHIIPLVEVTQGKETSRATAQLLMDVCRRIGKRPVWVKHEVPGFVGNRLQFAVFREALHLLSEGIASAEDIDAAMTAGPGLRYGLLGPLRTADLGGLDVFHAISSYLYTQLSDAKSPPSLLGELLQQGKLGAKTGEGFYPYSKKALGRIIAQRDRVLLQFLKTLANEENR